MSGTINRTNCPKCNMLDNLYIAIEFVAEPLGTWSLSGSRMKAVGRQRPVLRCKNCEFVLYGEFEGHNDSHAVFVPPKDGEPR